MDKTRIATVKATGKRYIVLQLDFRTDKAHVWGEVIEVVQKGRTLQTRHEGQKTFHLDEVIISEVDRTPPMLRELFNQRIEGLRAEGHIIDDHTTRRGNRRVTDYGTPEQQEARQRTVRRLAEELAPIAKAMNLGAWVAPTVVRGADKPIPETRPEILERMVERLTTKGAYLHRYSNGEFTSSSLALGLTLEDCRGVQVLETPGTTIHFDWALGVFWRHGGSFD